MILMQARDRASPTWTQQSENNMTGVAYCNAMSLFLPNNPKEISNPHLWIGASIYAVLLRLEKSIKSTAGKRVEKQGTHKRLQPLDVRQTVKEVEPQRRNNTAATSTCAEKPRSATWSQ
jgi:hypothetical protein